MIERPQPHQVSQNNKDAYSRRLGAREEPHHQRDQPSREDRPHKDNSKSQADVRPPNFCQGSNHAGIKQGDFSNARCKRIRTEKVC